MKKILIAFAIIAIAAFVLVGCSKKETGGGISTPSTTQAAQSTGGGLFEITDSEITVNGGDLSALPDYLKKGLGGELGQATLTSSDFLVTTYNVKKEQMHDLRDYYVNNCGTVKEINDKFIDDMGMFEIIYDWGQINAVMNASTTGGTTVTAMFY